MAHTTPSAPPLRETDEQRARAWWGAFFATALTLLGEVAYIFIDWRVHAGDLTLPTLRALHVLEAVGLLALLVARRRTASSQLSAGVFTAVALPYLIIFAVAEVAMAALGHVWLPLTGHRLLMLGIGMLAPAGLKVGLGLIGAFALESVLLWYGLALDERLDMPWEPWITLVWGGTGCGLLVFRVRTWRIEQRLQKARAEAESLERVARLFLAMRDAANTPLQSLEVGVSLLQQRSPENAALLVTMERALSRLRSLTVRMAIADPLLDWDSEEESIDAEEVLRNLEESLTRELERRRH
ncbi:hypothetical protein [Hyalangium sp.]|uniref:hypothetical protein n=1 Tax=Hyalangium sp. TaxID=2028555 RepID=UPI002D2A0939|nr:hypothetical protein [Hyalangium sp.]HYH96564.1 hypothetical protein [Hyalangium sp.]